MSTVPFRRNNPFPQDIAKKLPSNTDAERNVLGAILIDSGYPNAAMKAARGALVPDDFFVEENRRIFRNMLFLDDAQQPIEAVSLVENLTQNRELEAAGGAAYISSLMDGMPRLTNVAYYAKIIREKARLRQIVHLTWKVHNDAIEGYTSPDDLSAEIDSLSRQPSPSENPSIVVPFQELASIQLPDPKWCIEPLLTHGGTMMLYSWAGWGKSFIATEMAFSLSIGDTNIFGGHRGAGGNWPLHGPISVLYIYGEMHGAKIRERLFQISKGHAGKIPDDDRFGIMSKDYQTITRASRFSNTWRPSIATATDRRYIEERLFGGGYQLLVLDNISTLWSAAQEDQSKQTAILKDWFIDLNMHGVMVLVLQHAGKSGDFLGDSSQIHILDALMKLDHKGKYRRSDGLKVTVEIEKNRYEASDSGWLIPFELLLQTTPENGAQWLTRPAYKAQREAAFNMFRRNMKPPEVALEMHIHRSTAYRYFDEYKSDPNVKNWTEVDGDDE
jgi:DnaB-like helicase N terminal domain/AAA domain